MDLSNVRRMGKQPYETVREQLEELGDRVISRHGEDGAPARQGYRRFLGALDELAGRLLDDDEIAQRGQDLLKENEAGEAAEGAEPAEGAGAEGAAEGASAGSAAGAAGAAGGSGGSGAAGAAGASGASGADGTSGPEAAGAGESGAAGRAGVGDETPVTEADEAGESVWSQASDEADAAEGPQEAGVTQESGVAGVAGTTGAAGAAEDWRAGEAKVGESWAAGNARVAEETAAADGTTAPSPGSAEDAPGEPTVDVVFSLPAETRAERVTLCGEFNDWSVEATSLTKGIEGAWSVTVALVPGTYRYKYLLDGETWENGPDADQFEENAYGTLDSVIVVSADA